MTASESVTGAMLVEPTVDAVRRVVTRQQSERVTKAVERSEGFPDDLDIAGEQLADPVLSQVIRWVQTNVLPGSDQLASLPAEAKLYRGMLSTLKVVDGVLVRRNPPQRGVPGNWAIVLPERLRLPFVVACHKEGGHQGRAKTAELVSRRCYFPRWRILVAAVCNDCGLCATFCRGEPPRQGSMQLQEVNAPMSRLAMDLTGPHPTTKKQFKYILTITDCFSRYLWATPLRNHLAPTVITALKQTVFDRYGYCRELVSDQGTEFCSKLMIETLQELGIKKIRTTAYRPQSNGRCERAHRDLNAMFAKMVNKNHDDWDSVLSSVVASYNGTVNRSTGFTPNRLFLGREVLTKIDLQLPLKPAAGCGEGPTNYHEYVTALQQTTDRLQSIAQRNSAEAASKRKRLYDQKVRPASFEVGDLVLLRREFMPGKLYRRWFCKNDGPFVVRRRLNEVNYVIQRTPNGRPRTEHVDRLSKYRASPNRRDIVSAREAPADNICEPLRRSMRGSAESDGVAADVSKKKKRTK